MCYSAMVEQHLKSIGLRFKARIQTDLFEELFRRRVRDDTIKIPKALEANFLDPSTPEEARIQDAIEAYRAWRTSALETELFRQKKRFTEAQRSLQERETKKAREDVRIASHKIDWHVRKLAELKRTMLDPGDSRIFPFSYAPVLVREGGEMLLRPMRYHCRIQGKPETTDRKYPGLYNARRDNLEGFWNPLFGHRHAVLLISSFYENVARHDIEHRALQPDEKEENVILHFAPQPPAPMRVACLWDHWQSPGKPDLYSFAAITDDPPPEVAAAGHNRCIIPLKEEHIGRWIEPEGQSLEEL